MKNVRKLLAVFLLTAIVASMSTTGVYAINTDFSSPTHTHQFEICIFYAYTDMGSTHHYVDYIKLKKCRLCGYNEIIDAYNELIHHTFNVIDEHVGKTHYYSEICEFCEHVKYSDSYPCSGKPCIRPYSIIKGYTQ